MSLAFLSEHATQMGRSDSYSCVGFPQCMQGSAVPITGPLSFTSHPETFSVLRGFYARRNPGRYDAPRHCRFLGRWAVWTQKDSMLSITP